MKKKAEIIVPTLEKGEGSIRYDEKRKVYVYRKMVRGKREAVTGKTLPDVFKKMEEKEKSAKKTANILSENSASLLGDSLTFYVKNIKPKLGKESSFDRVMLTLLNQIMPYDLSKRQIKAIDTPMIAEHFMILINKGYSYSMISKTYNLLNEYFQYLYRKNPLNNPMLLYKKPTQKEMNAKVRKIEIMDDLQIALFQRRALERYQSGTQVYWWGYLLVILLNTGMRAGEALALQWLDIDFEKQTIKIDETKSIVIDWDAEPREDYKYTYKEVFTPPKTESSIRVIYAQKIVIDCLRAVMRRKGIVKKEDRIFLTMTGKSPNTKSNIYRALWAIYDYAGIEFENKGLHVLRHTFISKLCRKGIDKKVIAEIVGHSSTDVIERVYQHVLHEEKIEAMKQIEPTVYMDIDNL